MAGGIESPSRVLCIGIDAMDKDLVLKLVDEGVLPNFTSLFEKAAWGLTGCPRGFEAGAIWPAFNTGLNPGHQGQFSGNTHFDAGTYRDFVFYKKGEIKWHPFWNILSNGNKRVVLIDPAYSHPQDNINGISVNEWATHARRDDSVFCTYPSHLASEIANRFGTDVIGKCDEHRPQTAQEHVAFRDNLIDRVRRKTALSSYLLEREDWDFFLTVYYDAHCVGHQCWHIHDTASAYHDAVLRDAIGDPVRDVYVEIDASIGKLLRQVDDETMVIVYCSHGMTNMYTGSYFLDDVLMALDESRDSHIRDSAVGFIRKAWVNAPGPIRRALMPLRGKVVDHLADKEGRRFFEMVNNHATGGIRINLVGRERNGLVQPGAEYDAVCQQLIEDLSGFTHAESGEPLFEEILKTVDIYDGDFVHELPDLLVRWNRPTPITAAYSPKTGRLENKHAYGRSGDHTPTGLFFAAGPSVTPKALNRTVASIDFAPTISSLLGVESARFDGERISEIC